MASLLFCLTHRSHTEKHGPVGSAYWSDDYQGLLFIVFKEISCAHWLFCCSDKTPIPKAIWGGKGFIWAYSSQPITAHCEERPRQTCEAGVCQQEFRQTPEDCCLLFTPQAHAPFSYFQGHLLRGGAHHRELGLPHQSLIMKKPHWHAFRLVLPCPSSVILACVRLIDKLAHQHKAKCLLHCFLNGAYL